MEAVWATEVGAASLSRTLAALKHTLEHVADAEIAQRLLIVADDHCTLTPDMYQLDVDLFEQVYDLAVHVEDAEGLEAAAPLYAQALDLYGGPYLADIGRASWAQERRDLLASHFINGCERLAENAYAEGRYRQCLELCRVALDADMAADEVTVWVLRAYAALGRSAELEQAYAAYLRAVRLDPHSDEAHDDVVVEAYEQLAEMRVAGE